MKKLIARKPSTDNAIKGFTAALSELEAVEAAEVARMSRIQSEIDMLRDQQDEAASARDRASRLRAKFADFLAA
ncbi:hypothetical protein CO661_24185 [Sinorhizobium fredii]|uniref:Uncharacterized protein n=1 Tax=Rhizobium fredii TaxID=380 RepID=A0A2A6LRY7_RHIFR|nr:hypothetical protein [Sinorhizobium fredii]PDT45364.1 hypothetical protein CO661_24185 [Sinorhizobium fredii]